MSFMKDYSTISDDELCVIKDTKKTKPKKKGKKQNWAQYYEKVKTEEVFKTDPDCMNIDKIITDKWYD